jgi:hypothetical protein
MGILLAGSEAVDDASSCEREAEKRARACSAQR